MFTFPTKLFPPTTMTWRIKGAAVGGGTSLSGVTQSGTFDAGGHWEADLEKSYLWTRPTFKTWEAVAAMSDNGATPFVVPMDNRNAGPFADPTRPAGDPFSDDSTFSDNSLWTDAQITAALTGSAARRATQIAFTYAGDAAPVGGEHFTIWHASGAQRLYRIVNVLSVASGVVGCLIRPPLREPCAAATPVDFNNPRCQMHVVGDMAAAIELLKRGSGSVKFEEDFQPYANFP